MALFVALAAGCDGEAMEPDEDDPDCMRARALTIDGCGELIGESFCSEGREHVAFGSELRYDSNPPHSGPHYPNATFWGIHDSTVDRGTYVHNLEHGGIVLAFNCSDCDDEVRALRDAVAARPDFRILVTRDVDLPTRFAAISWTWVYAFDAIDTDALLCFIDQHEGFAPENIAK
ncbi:MAG: DUF3105 domain-containing protein [Myxococcota bacterium]